MSLDASGLGRRIARRAWFLICLLVVLVSVLGALILWRNAQVFDAALLLFFGAILTPILGARLGHMAATLNATQLRLREEERRRAAQQFEILESISDGFYAFDAQWRVIYANAQAQRYFKMSGEEMLGRTIWELFPSIVGSQLDNEYRRAMTTREHVHIEILSPLTLRTLDLHVYPHASGGLSAYFRDITEEKQIRDELIFSREQLENAIQSTGFAAGWYNPANDVLKFERNVGGLWGLSEVVTSLSQLKNLFHPDDLGYVQSEIAGLMEAGSGTYEFEMRFRRANDAPEADWRWLVTRGELTPDSTGALGMAGILYDITDRKRAEIALQTSERRYRSLVAATSNIVFLASPDVSRIRMSGWHEFTGLEVEEFGADEWIALLHPDERDEMVARWMEMLRDKVGGTLTYRMRHRSGEYRWVVSSGVPVWNEKGELIEWVGTITDVHAQREAEAREKQGEQRLKHVLEGANVAVWVWEPEPDLLHYQHNFEGVFGLDGPLENFVHLARLLHPDDVERVAAVVAQHVEKCSGFDVEYRIRIGEEQSVENSQWRWILARAVAARKSETGFVEFTGVCLDISQIKQTEEALRASETRYRALVDVAPQIVFSTRPDGWNTYFSPQWSEFVGMTIEESLGFGWMKAIHPDDVARAMPVWKNASATGQMYEVESRYRRASDGQWRWQLVRGMPVRSTNGEVESWTGVIADIHERVVAEEERARLLHEAQEANRAKDEFLAVVSHELRTPLSSILGWTEILRSGVDEATLMRALDVIERNGRAQVQIIEDILDVARLTTGKLRLQLTPQSFDFITRDAVNGILPLAANHNIEIQTHLTVSGPNATVLGDAGRLRQIVCNLLSNAVKFTPDGGRVIVSLALEESEGREAGAPREIKLEITDTGRGIASEFLPHVFDRFRQADSSSTRSAGGLGLGLSLVNSLTQMHGGRVEANSPGENQGATFTVFLPVHAEEHELEAPPLPVKELGCLSGLRILALDDEDDARELLRLLLLREDARVQVAGLATEALALSHSTSFDLVISDLAMPGEDGFWLLEQLREAHGEKLPVIALTAYASQADRDAVANAGFAGYLAKPFHVEDLMATILAVLGRDE